MPDNAGIFISYASADRERVRPIVADIQNQGITCWFDEQQLKPFDAELSKRISQGIERTALTMAFVSETYQTREACRWELLRTLQTSGMAGLLLVRLDQSQSRWSILKENVFCDLAGEGAGQIRDLLEALRPPIRARPARGVRAEPGPWSQEWASNAFEGRFDERLRLVSMFTSHVAERVDQVRRARQVQIVGLGGQGKSMLALQCASDLALRYPGGILRLNAGGDLEGSEVTDTTSTLERLLGQIHGWALRKSQATGEQISLPDRSAEDVWESTRTALKPLVRGTLWLIDDLPKGLSDSELNRLICPAPGDTLITTRTDAYKSHFPYTTLTLDAFSPEEAVYVLARGSAQTMEEDAQVLGEIAKTVGYHALSLAVLSPRVEAWSAHRVLQDLRSAPIDQLEECAQDIGDLPAGHGPSVVATLRMSIEGLLRPEARDIMRLAAIWPPGSPLPLEMLDAVIGRGAARGVTEVVTSNLARRDGSGLLVHAIISSVAEWLIVNDPHSALTDAHRVRSLRSESAAWLEPLVKATNLWDASDAGRTAWHVLEPVDGDWMHSDSTVAYLSLMAMARLPMRHKPPMLSGDALTEHLSTAVGWARRAETVFPGDARDDALRRGRALAMEGLLKLSLARRLPQPQQRRSQALEGQSLLEQSLQLRRPWLANSDDAEDQDELERAHFNYGRGFLTMAKILAEAGDHAGAGHALDQAENTYIRIGGTRHAHFDTDVDDEGPEKLASCLRGEAIVALTRVTHQTGAGLDERRAWLTHATECLSRAMELTCPVAAGSDNATPDMCKDVALGIKIDVVSRILDGGPDIDVDALLESLMRQVDDTPVPWAATSPTAMAGAAIGFARLRIAAERGGKGTRPQGVADELLDEDYPALRRTLGWTP